ncbi:hypothetical protein ACFZB2_37020 [Streptomyces bobili]|uniref:hypothetical protein n=1 Tax=Streptomyces bobili TaxID=67280 RepID=UPI0036E5872C
MTVPALTAESDHPLPVGKKMRSRVSGWTTRPLAAKPVKKTTPATRLAALFLAAYSSSNLHGTLPNDLPDACRALLPDLQSKNFFADLFGDSYRLDPGVRHLAGLLPNPADPHEPATPRGTPNQPEISAAEWAQWKDQASPTLRRHAEAVETSAIWALPFDQLAAAFASTPCLVPAPRIRA